MAQFYSEPAREQDTWSLPDAEVFYRTEAENLADGWLYEDGAEPVEPLPAGWYYWYCFPGCMPDSEPSGPYPTEQEAIDACRENV